MFDPKWLHQATKTVVTTVLALVIVLSLASCGSSPDVSRALKSVNSASNQNVAQIAEVSPPQVIQQLRQELDHHQPQVSILSPQPNEVLQDNTVTVQFQVQDLPIFKNKELGLGPHIHVFLDNQSYIALYDLKEPLVFKDLAPGTHTIRAFASRPWHESFKNEGAYAQTTFHIFTKTDENNPNPDLPLLTYSRPQGNYGAEPIMLDFYLTKTAQHLVTEENPDQEIADWQIRCTINGESFIINQWQPIYLTGFHTGKNWVQVELLDQQGNPIQNIFHNTARLITYEPGGTDTLSKLVRGELSVTNARGIVDPNYIPTPPEPAAVTTPAPKETPQSTVDTTPTPAQTTETTIEPKATSIEQTTTKEPAVTKVEPIKALDTEKEIPVEPSVPKAEISDPAAEKTSSGLPPTLPEIIKTATPKSSNLTAPVSPEETKAELNVDETPTSQSENTAKLTVESQQLPLEEAAKSAEETALPEESSDVVEVTPAPTSSPAPKAEVEKVETLTPKSVTSETANPQPESKIESKSETSKPPETVSLPWS